MIPIPPDSEGKERAAAFVQDLTDCFDEIFIGETCSIKEFFSSKYTEEVYKIMDDDQYNYMAKVYFSPTLSSMTTFLTFVSINR